MNFLVWRRGLRGPSPSLDTMDPRSMMSWALIEPTIISIVPLVEHEREMHLDTLMALHPCPEVGSTDAMAELNNARDTALREIG